ncbi:MAG: GtrA family protein [Citrobacter freundii]|nr:MAG: GtrA family protein [Citrobacter freundii]
MMCWRGFIRLPSCRDFYSYLRQKARSDMKMFLKANVASLIASLIDYLITFLLVELLHVVKFYAMVTGTVCGGVINFMIGRVWVFKALDGAVRRQAWRYLVVWAGNLILNAAGYYLLEKKAGVYYMLAKLVTSLIVAVGWNYPLQKRYVFLNNTK